MDNARFLMVPIRFSQHEHRILTGQKPYFKRVLPLFSKPYRVFAHAEIESYLEDRVWDTVLAAKNIWDNQGKAGRVLLCVVAFSGQEMEPPPDTITPLKGNKNVSLDKLKITKKIDIAIRCFKSVIAQNHGIKETNTKSVEYRLLMRIGKRQEAKGGIDNQSLITGFSITY